MIDDLDLFVESYSENLKSEAIYEFEQQRIKDHIKREQTKLKNNNMKTGIDLIKQEKDEQINKHYRTIEYDIANNDDQQLSEGALMLLSRDYMEGVDSDTFPDTWDKDICMKMCSKPYKERLIIAGALIAAELDRLNYAIKPDKLEVWDYVVMNDGKVRQITADDMPDLKFEDVDRLATPKETAEAKAKLIEEMNKDIKETNKQSNLSNIQKLISDQDLNTAWGNANFGNTPKRDVLKNGLLKVSSGYETGHTLKCILEELQLIKGAGGRAKGYYLTRKGKDYLFEAYSKGDSF